MANINTLYISQSDRNGHNSNSKLIPANNNNGDKLIEGWIEKKSRYLGKWRVRWAVLRRYKFTFMLCTFKKKSPPAYSSYKKVKKKSYKATEAMIIDYNTIITTYDKSFKQYIDDRFNIHFVGLNILNQTFQLRMNLVKSKYNSNDWINAICKAKLLSQESLHRMIPYYILSYCSRKYLNKHSFSSNSFPVGITQVIINFMHQDYNLKNVNFEIWKWNRYHSIFNINNHHHITKNKTYYFVCNEAISKGKLKNKALVHDTVFSINNKGNSNINQTSTCTVMNNPFDLKLNNFNKNHKIIYHSLPAILPNENDLLLPSITYHNNHLFVTGGCYQNQNGTYGINDSIYFMDFNCLKWKWTQIKSNKISITTYGCSVLFIENDKLMVVGGWDKITKAAKNVCKNVLLITFNDNNYSYDDGGLNIMHLNDTQRKHSFGGIVGNIGYDKNKICIGSQRYLEIYDCHKDLWCLYGWKTKVIHQRPQIWCDDYDKNILYIAGNGSDRIEWIDIRQQYKWKCFKYYHCQKNINSQNQTNFSNNYTPSIVVI